MDTGSTVTIVGGGPCGLGVAMYLQQFFPTARATILEKCIAGESASPLAVRCAAQAVSQNVSESACSGWFRAMESAGRISEESDERLSQTEERPHGWSRLSGQWRHYRCPDRAALFAAMRESAIKEQGVHLCCHEVNSVSLCGDSLSLAVEMVRSQEASESSHHRIIVAASSVLVLAVPAHEALRITSKLPLPCAVIEVLRRIALDQAKSITRYCTSIRVASALSVGQALAAKFQGKRELNVSNVPQGGVTLLLLSLDSDLYVNDGLDEIIVHVHAHSSDALGRKELTTWLTSWLFATLDENHIAKVDADVVIATSHAFTQSRSSIAPLSPMRERGCILVPMGQPSASMSDTGGTTTDCTTSPPLLVLCGDWAVEESAGTVSGALLSAYKGAREIAEHLNQQSASTSRESSKYGTTL